FARCFQMTFRGLGGAFNSENLKICPHCSWKKPEGCSAPWQNKDVCFICKEFIFVNMQSNKLAYRCLKHSFNQRSNPQMYECCICKNMYLRETMGTVNALYCNFCKHDQCCMFEFE